MTRSTQPRSQPLARFRTRPRTVGSQGARCPHATARVRLARQDVEVWTNAQMRMRRVDQRKPLPEVCRSAPPSDSHADSRAGARPPSRSTLDQTAMPPTSPGFSARPRSQAAPTAASASGFSARPAARGNTNRQIWRAPGWVWLLVGVASLAMGVATLRSASSSSAWSPPSEGWPPDPQEDQLDESPSDSTDEAATRALLVRYYTNAGMSQTTAECTADRTFAIDQSGGSSLDYGQIVCDCDYMLEDIDALERATTRLREDARANGYEGP